MNHRYIIDIIQKHYTNRGNIPFHKPDRIVVTSKHNRGGAWYPPMLTTDNDRPIPAWIEIGWEDSPEILWHEIFHGVFHDSPIRRSNSAWGEAFCNVFAFLEGKCPLDWGITPELFEVALTDEHTRLYTLPAALLLRASIMSREQFRTNWRLWNSLPDSKGWLDRALNYDPTTGKCLTEFETGVE